jgi:hypothetical protein
MLSATSRAQLVRSNIQARGEAYQVDDVGADYVGEVADNVDERDSLGSDDRRQHLRGVLEANVRGDVDAEAREDRHRHCRCT